MYNFFKRFPLGVGYIRVVYCRFKRVCFLSPEGAFATYSFGAKRSCHAAQDVTFLFNFSFLFFFEPKERQVKRQVFVMSVLTLISSEITISSPLRTLLHPSSSLQLLPSPVQPFTHGK